MNSNLADFVYYRLIYDYLRKDITQFGLDVMQRSMKWAAGIALTLVTIWVFIQGLRVLTGQSRVPLMQTVLNLGRIAVIVGAATTMSVSGTNLHRWLTVDLDQEIHGLLTKHDNSSTASAIDENLAYTQLALGAISIVQVAPDDAETLGTKVRSQFIAAFGTASPPMVAGAMFLVYQFGIALFIGLGPLFILTLIFEQTKGMFQRWLMYGIGTIFSMAMLSFVTGLVLKLTLKVSAALWGAKIINKLLGTDAVGISTLALQQGGIGLLLSVLIVSVPPMAAMFFQGTLGSAVTYSVFQGTGGQPGPQGQPAGSMTSHDGAGERTAGSLRDTTKRSLHTENMQRHDDDQVRSHQGHQGWHQ